MSTDRSDLLEPLYLGFDLSTQQLKALAVTPSLKVAYTATFDFDLDSTSFTIKNGVITNESEHEVYAPVALWLQAVDQVLERLKQKGLDFRRIKGISGAGQQHGSVYWSQKAETILSALKPECTLEGQLSEAFSWPYSPNWQDASTQTECDAFDKELGNEHDLAMATGSKAHHRFTGPQILRFRKRHPEEYYKTSRISLVSSFLASVFLGKIAPMDISDVCGMNLWDIGAGTYSNKLLDLTTGTGQTADLRAMLGPVVMDGGASLGSISDNPATILALPLRPLDAIVSLGTSTTFLMSTPHYKPDPSVHFFNHPTTPGLYMFMLCYKNGGLAREQIRDALNATSNTSKSWSKFEQVCSEAPILGQKVETDPMKMGLYFPRPEIVPNICAGEWHYLYSAHSNPLCQPSEQDWSSPQDDARAIVESQLLSLRLRSRDIVSPPTPGTPAQPRRIYLVGGGSQSPAIARMAGEVLGGAEGVNRLDIGENACALGAAYKAVWAGERKEGQTFEDFVGGLWKEDDFSRKIADGYQEGVFERFGIALKGFEMMEIEVLKLEGWRKYR